MLEFFFLRKKATMISNKEEKKKSLTDFLGKLSRNAYLSGYALNMKAIY